MEEKHEKQNENQEISNENNENQTQPTKKYKKSTEIFVVDSVMGSYKTSAAINMINRSPDDTHFIYITPYLDEVKRIMKECSKKNFKQPKSNKENKIVNIKKLIENGYNIVSTHALFRNFNKNTIDLIKTMNYILIMDEVTEVISTFEDAEYGIINQMSETDIKMLQKNKLISINKKINQVKWLDENYEGVFSGLKNICEQNNIVMYNSIPLWIFSIEVFKSFKQVYILTYLFDGQIQKYYFDLFKIKYRKLSVKEKGIRRYEFVRYVGDYVNINNYDYKNLIEILEDANLNRIGEQNIHDLSSSWYKKASKDKLNELKNNIYNFFYHKTGTKSEYNLWTTFKDYKEKLKGKGYTNGYLPFNSRATNKYKQTTSVAYTVNRFMNPVIKNYFIQNGIEVDEDCYALSEMLQFIWRSGIREGKKITIYIPSIRMRNLLKDWIDNIMCTEVKVKIKQKKPIRKGRGRKPKKLSDEDINTIIERNKNGETFENISKDYGMSRITLYKIIKNNI